MSWCPVPVNVNIMILVGKKKTQKVNCDEKCVTEDIVKSPTAKLYSQVTNSKTQQCGGVCQYALLYFFGGTQNYALGNDQNKIVYTCT